MASGATDPPQRSRPGPSEVIGAVIRRPSGATRTAVALTAPWPSANTVAVTGNSSPTTALAGQVPALTDGRTSSTGIRPTTEPGVGRASSELVTAELVT